METATASKAFIISLLFYLHYILLSDCTPCTDFTITDDCALDNRCAWSSTEGCYCASDAPIDVLFIMDESGSMGSSHYADEKQFVIDMIEKGLSDESHAHVVKFASSYSNVYKFWSTQFPRDTMVSRISGASYRKGGTYMSKVLQYVDNVFETWESKTTKGYEGFDRLLVFLTDGKPTSGYEPCDVIADVQAVVGEENIIVVGMSGFEEASIECMVTPGYPSGSSDPDYNRILEVSEFTQEAFDSAFRAADSFLCPETFSLKITEVRIEEYNLDGVHNSRFVEFYNNGQDLKLSENTLAFDGFLTSTAFGKDGVSTCNIEIPKNKFVVIYDYDAPDIPTCTNCNCTKDANTQCEEAIYIACNAVDTTSGCGACTWDTDTATSSNDKWTQTVSDYVAQVPLSSVTRDNRNATGWVRVYTGYSTELKSKSYIETEAVNWDMSCYSTGTPGADPVSPCRATCIAEVCQSKGDTGAGCDVSGKFCECTVADKYYLSDTSPSCVLLVAPMNCTVQNYYDPELGDVATIRWKKGGNDNPGAWFEVDDTKEVSTTYGLEILKQYAVAGGTTVTVRSVYNDRLQGDVYSAIATCGVDTIAPTNAPTPTPTMSNADVPWCTATVEGYDTVRLRWAEAEQWQTSDIAAPYKYYIYGNWISGDDSTGIVPVSTSTLFETLYPDPVLDIANNDDPEIYIVVEIENAETGGIDYERMKTDGEGKVLCTVITPSPTDDPTSSPTKDPTDSPTKEPTDTPTRSPTYGAWIMDECSVTIPAKDYISDEGLLIRFQYTSDTDADDEPLLEFLLNDAQAATAGATDDGTSFARAVGVSQTDVETAMTNGKFEARVWYNIQDGQAKVVSEITTCDYTTTAPTKSPTESPSTDPTAQPTEDPSVSPTRDPSKSPTKAPTFEKLTLTQCTAEITVDLRDVSVEFTETIFDDNDPEGRYPSKTDIYYVITVGPSKTNTYHSQQESADISGGLRKVSLILPDDFEFVVKKSYVTVDIADGLGDSGVPFTCELITQAPTTSPVTPSPTQFPTSISPVVRLDLLDDLDEVREGDWGLDGGCINLGLDDARRRRLQSTDAPVVADIVNNCPFCPVCTVKEDVNIKYLRIIREPADFPFDVVVEFKVTHLEDTNGDGISVDDFDMDKTDSDWKTLFAANKPTEKEYIVGGTSSNTIVIPYYLTVNDDEDGETETTEAFEFRIDSCEIDETGGATNPIPDGLSGVYSCTVGNYYAAAIISVEQPEDPGLMTTTRLGDLPTWIWWPLGFAAAAIPFVAYLIYRFWKGKKKADKMEVQRTFELGKAEEQDDMGEFGVVGDYVTNNPLATGAAFEVDKGDVAIDKHLAIEKMNFEMATTEVEHNIFKQDFGPVQAEKHDMDAPARPETADTTAETEDVAN